MPYSVMVRVHPAEEPWRHMQNGQIYGLTPRTPRTGSSQTLVYDADGNLTFDGIWTYQWDAENRLISMSMTNIAGLAYSNRLRLDFAYDYMNRRISKIVSTNSTGSSFVSQSTNYFIYDGWNLIAAFSPAGSIQQSYVWGLDLSGTIGSGGGIGGLLEIANSGTNYFGLFDGNGNITGLINGTDRSISARYEYSPFGEIIRSTGAMAKVNPFRFSTKFHDDESGLVYYGYRYYSPNLGRWLGRDPLEELGGNNLYSFVDNDVSDQYDPLGEYAAILYGEDIELSDAQAGGMALLLTAGVMTVAQQYDTQLNIAEVAMDLDIGNLFDNAVNVMAQSFKAPSIFAKKGGKQNIKNEFSGLTPDQLKQEYNDADPRTPEGRAIRQKIKQAQKAQGARRNRQQQ